MWSLRKDRHSITLEVLPSLDVHWLRKWIFLLLWRRLHGVLYRIAKDWRKWRFPPKWQPLKKPHSIVAAHRLQSLRECMSFNRLDSWLSVAAHRLKLLTSTKALTLMTGLSLVAIHALIIFEGNEWHLVCNTQWFYRSILLRRNIQSLITTLS